MPPSPTATVLDAAFEADGFGTLVLDVPEAHLHLQPHDEADRVQVHGTVPGADPDAARCLFDRKGIATHQSGDRLRVSGERLSDGVPDWHWRWGHPTALHLTVHLPPDLDVTARAPGGEVEASDLGGNVDLTVPGGSVHATGLTGAVNVRGGGGTLTVQDADGGRTALRWAAGPVVLERLHATTVTLHSHSGPTTAQDLDGPTDLCVQGAPLALRHVTGPCDAEVRGGSLTYRGAPENPTTLRSVGGPLQAYLPPDQPAAFSFAGTQVRLDDDFAFKGERTPHHVEGRLNGGGPSFEGRAVQGAARCRVLSRA